MLSLPYTESHSCLVYMLPLYVDLMTMPELTLSNA